MIWELIEKEDHNIVFLNNTNKHNIRYLEHSIPQ